MPERRQRSRRIALFVEGDTECGDSRRKTLPVFFHNWLDPQLPPHGKVGDPGRQVPGREQLPR